MASFGLAFFTDVLRLQFTAKQSTSEPNLLLIEDVTPVYNNPLALGGWGAPNLARSALTYVVFRLTTPGGHRLYTGPISWKSGVYKLFAASFKTVSEQLPRYNCDRRCDCHGRCSGLANFTFADGQYELSYEVWAMTHVPAQTASYHLALELCDTEQVWALKNGTWTNIGSQGAYNDEGLWEWTLFDTTDSYTTYETRTYTRDPGYFVIGLTGPIDKVLGPSPTQPETTTTEPAMIAGSSIQVLLTQRLARRLALATTGLLVPRREFRPPVSSYTDLDTLLELYTAQALLEDVQQSGETTSMAVGLAVADIEQRVCYLETQLNYVR